MNSIFVPASKPTYSQNPPTIEEMEDIYFLLRTLKKHVHDKELIRSVEDAQYVLKDAIERPQAEAA